MTQQHDGVYQLRFSYAFERHFPEEMQGRSRTRCHVRPLGRARARGGRASSPSDTRSSTGSVELPGSSDCGGITSYRTVLSDEVEPARGWFFVYELELRGMATARELLPVFVNEDGRRR